MLLLGHICMLLWHICMLLWHICMLLGHICMLLWHSPDLGRSWTPEPCSRIALRRHMVREGKARVHGAAEAASGGPPP